MYVLYQTLSSPLQNDWCSLGLGQYTTGVLATLTDHIKPNSGANTTLVYANSTGLASIGNVYTNQKGTLTYSFIGTGTTSQNISTAPPYSDGGLQSIVSGGTTNYTFLIRDANTGQKATFTNSVNWI